MKSNISQREWDRHIKSWKESGRRQREYCANHGLNLWTFRGHLKKSSSTPKEGFTEIHVQPSVCETIRIEVKGRYTVELPVIATEEVIGRIIRAIEAVE